MTDACAELGIFSMLKKSSEIVYSSNKCDDKIISFRQYAWMDSSNLLYYSHEDDSLSLLQYDLNTKKTSSKGTIPNEYHGYLLENIRGENLYFESIKDSGRSNDTLSKVKIENSAKVEDLFTIGYRDVEMLSISPDEKYVVYNTGLQENGVIFRELNGNIIKKFAEPNILIGARVGQSIFHSPDSRHVAISGFVNHKSGVIIFDSAGNKINEITGEQISSLIKNLTDVTKIGTDDIRYFAYSPDSKRIFIIYTFYLGEGGDYTSYGLYAFMGDADGKNLKKVPFVGDGIKSINSYKDNPEAQYKAFAGYSMNDIIGFGGVHW